MSKAQDIVDQMLDEAYDAHVKAHERVQKWDKAHGSYQKLWKLKRKAHDLFREMGRAVGYERALAHVGLSREDVAHPIRGGQVGATHNYKVKMPVKVCRDQYCNLNGKAQPKQTEVCGSCGNEVKTEMVPTPPSALRGKLASYIVGVETNDGRTVFFPEPVSQEADWEQSSDEEEKPKPPTASEAEQQKRLGKWW